MTSKFRFKGWVGGSPVESGWWVVQAGNSMNEILGDRESTEGAIFFTSPSSRWQKILVYAAAHPPSKLSGPQLLNVNKLKNMGNEPDHLGSNSSFSHCWQWDLQQVTWDASSASASSIVELGKSLHIPYVRK